MLTVISYNIHSGVGTDGVQSYERIGKFLQQQGADIVLLQEMNTRSPERETSDDLAALCGDHFHEVVPSSSIETEHGWYGNAVLTRLPVISSASFDVSVGEFEPRNIQEVVIATPDGRLRVVNTHKGLKSKERRFQFRRLYEYLQQMQEHRPMPTVIGGDFNEWWLMTRAFRTLNRFMNPVPLAATFPSRFPIFRLDRFWVTSNISVVAAERIKTAETKVLSDHCPIKLTLTSNNR